MLHVLTSCVYFVLEVGGQPTQETHVYWVFDKPTGDRVKEFLEGKGVKGLIINIWTVTNVKNKRHYQNPDFGEAELALRRKLREGLGRDPQGPGGDIQGTDTRSEFK